MSFRLERHNEEDIEDLLRRVLDEMPAGTRDYLSELVASGGSVDFFIGLFCNDKNIGMVVDAELIRSLASVGIGLQLDMYP